MPILHFQNISHTHRMQIIDKIYISTYLTTKSGSTSNLFKEGE